ncbi:MAG: quinolinate synthase NadA, partial [Clostridia bacterium]|nr:quinolinate synthase NadA [Clostridia bacterium]
KILVHPECRPEITKLADFVGSTSEILDYARASEDKEFIIGTELSIAEHLQYEFPDKQFYPLSVGMVCKNMRLTTLMDVYNCVRGTAGEEIELDKDTIRDAKRCIDEMIRLNHE